MWWLLRLLAAQGGGQTGWRLGSGGISNDEAFAQRINGDLHLGDFQKAMAAYKADPAYWQKLYGSDPYFSDVHTPDIAHGGAVLASKYFNTSPLGTSSDATANPVVPNDAPNFPAPRKGKRSEAPGGLAPTAIAATEAPSAPQTLFSQSLSTGDLSGIDPSSSANTPSWPQTYQSAPPLQPDPTQDAADRGPTRFLVRRTYDPGIALRRATHAVTTIARRIVVAQ
jgi:hypothetical protein